MYRPNRIGPWPIGNLNKVLLTDAKTSFDAVDTSFEQYSCYSLNTVSGIEVITEKVVFTNATITLLDGQQVGIGVQLAGGDEEFDRYIYAISGRLYCRTSNDILAEMVVGRLAAAPSSSVAVNVANPIVLPCTVMNHNNQNHYSACSTQLITTELDGGTPPGTFFDLACFWRIANNDAGTSTLEGLELNISFHKYSSDLFTFDPNR